MNSGGVGLVDILKQHRPCLVFEALSKPQDKEVIVSCTLDETSFQSTGVSFEAAKHQTALRVLRHLMISDPKIRADNRFEAYLDNSPNEAPVAAGDTKAAAAGTLPVEAQNMSPLMYFNQISQSDSAQWQLDHLSYRPSSFKATLTLKDRKFEAVDHTKKLAKQKAAKQALWEVYGLDADTLHMPSLPKRRRLNDNSAPSEPKQAPSLNPNATSQRKFAAPASPAAPPAPPAAVPPPSAAVPPPPTAPSPAAASPAKANATGEPSAKRKRRFGSAHFRSKAGGGKNPGSGNRCPCYSRDRNPLQVLNEFRRGIAFNLVSMEGPSHAPTITMTAEVDGRVFEGQATSKQRAKMLVGSQIVAYFEEAGLLMLVSGDANAADANANVGPGPWAGGMTQSGAVPMEKPKSEDHKTPLMRLYELMPNRPSCDTWEDKKQNIFVASFSINGQTYQGRGVTKQKAMHAAAEQVLCNVFNVTMEPPSGIPANYLPPVLSVPPMVT